MATSRRRTYNLLSILGGNMRILANFKGNYVSSGDTFTYTEPASGMQLLTVYNGKIIGIGNSLRMTNSDGTSFSTEYDSGTATMTVMSGSDDLGSMNIIVIECEIV